MAVGTQQTGAAFGRLGRHVARGVLLAFGLAALLVARLSAQQKDSNPHGKIEVACATCHSAEAWKPARIQKSFNHGSYGFPLDGGHSSVSCASCHKSLVFSQATKTCASCHQDIHKGELGVQCADCHNTRSFTDRTTQVAAHALTRFPLEGAHRTVDCRNCHTSRSEGNLVFRGTATDCISCHQRDYDQTTSPNHPAAAFKKDCTGCHTNTTWQGGRFDHQTTQFPLSGAHQSATCENCHADRIYRGKPTTCVSCHLPAYTQSKLPPHDAARFPTDCASCHVTTKWQGAPYDHNLTKFPLTGAHVPLTCQACHADQVFVGKPTTCVSCHQPDWAATKTPPHQAAGFPTECATCHTTAKWPGATFDHNRTKFPLTGSHQPLTCTACHADQVYVGKPTTCVSCHQPDYTKTSQPPHQAAGFPTDCASCHNTTKWPGAPFDHSKTQFALTGAHVATTCMQCHADGVYKGKPTTCVSCHQQDYTKTSQPPHQAAGFPTDCATCHTTTKWPGAVFDHNKTLFPLTGAHVATTCAQCHADGIFKGKPTTCVSCHQPDYTKTAQPPHQAAGFSTDCATCHNTSRWPGAIFDHNKTPFPLTGSHTATPCMQCHADGVYKGKPTSCVSCHQPDYTKTTQPPHQAAGFPTTCSTCHTTTKWVPGTFNHNTTLFPLTGAHAATPCMQCHADGVYKGKPTTCVSCHQPDYNNSSQPPHKAAGFPTDCTACHNTTKWTGTSFDHNKTLFPLTGTHQVTPCMQCHADGVYKGKPTTCVSCHQPDYNSSSQPPHKAAGFPTTCANCHTTVKWVPGTFDHNATLFPLTGAHVATPCTQCHADGVYKGKPTTCVSCHQPDFDNSTQPPHKAAGFPTSCTLCHTTTKWIPGSFDHNASQFPLTGAHLATPCMQCHADGVYKGKPTTCVSCHQPDFDNSTDPAHKAAAFPTTCASCHNTTKWPGVPYNHNATLFPLTGAHIPLRCKDCHADGIYKGKPTTCVSCHQVDYTKTTQPPHQAAGFSTTCATCHTTTQWPGAVFNHNATLFPLTGTHVTTPCAQCHADGVYKGKPTTCVSCHQTDYAATTNPNHTAAHFPNTCASCHNTVRWDQATFNHDGQYFPIYSGNHRTVWTSCATCHTNPADYTAFTCITCHTHSQSSTDRNHSQVNGYQYNSTKCYSCHPRG